MGLFSRLGTLLKSNLNELVNRAEDPEKVLNQVLLDMQQQLVEAKKAVAIAIADEKKLGKQYNLELDKAKDWERKAMLAVRAGDDGLARQALARKNEHEEISAQFQQQWIAQKGAVDKLKDALRLLANKIEEAKRKKNILIARKKRAQAQSQIANTMQGLGNTNAFDTFDRMADQIHMLEAEAEAGAELAGEIGGGTLESKFLALESGGVGSEEDALNELKAKMGLLSAGSSSEAKRLEAGDNRAETVDETNGGSVTGGLSEEDLKELEDLDLSGVDMEELKSELNKMEEEMGESGDEADKKSAAK